MNLLAFVVPFKKFYLLCKRHLLLLPIIGIFVVITKSLLKNQEPYLFDPKLNSDPISPQFTDPIRYLDLVSSYEIHNFSSIKNQNSDLSKTVLDYPSIDGLVAPLRIEIYQESATSPVKEIIELEKTIVSRNYKLEKVCQSKTSQLNYTLQPKEFFINDDFKLVWCNIFKAASTSWIYNFLKMKKITEKEITRRVRNGATPLSFARQNFYPRPSLEEVEEKLRNKDYVSFIIVREPLRRLLSSYISKIKRPSRHYADLKCQMVAIFGKIRRRVCNPTFSEFVSWVINESATMAGNEHWVSYTKFCSPCKAQFTYILNFENLRKEHKFLLEKIPKLKKVYINRKISSGETIDDELFDKYLKELNANQIRGLLHGVYKYDYEMFGYPTDIYDKFSNNIS